MHIAYFIRNKQKILKLRMDEYEYEFCDRNERALIVVNLVNLKIG